MRFLDAVRLECFEHEVEMRHLGIPCRHRFVIEVIRILGNLSAGLAAQNLRNPRVVLPIDLCRLYHLLLFEESPSDPSAYLALALLRFCFGFPRSQSLTVALNAVLSNTERRRLITALFELS